VAVSDADLDALFRASLDEFGVEVTLRTVSGQPAGRDAATGRRAGTVTISEALTATRSADRAVTVSTGQSWVRVREVDYRFATADLTGSLGRLPAEREQIVEGTALWHVARVWHECNGRVTVCTVRDAAV